MSKSKMFTNGLKLCLPPQAWIKKIVNGVETHQLSNK